MQRRLRKDIDETIKKDLEVNGLSTDKIYEHYDTIGCM